MARWTSRRRLPRISSGSPAGRDGRRLGQLAGTEPGREVVGDAAGEDEALEERVAREAVGAVDAGARRLAARVEALERRPSAQVGAHAAARVVLRRVRPGAAAWPGRSRARGSAGRSTGSAARGTRRRGGGSRGRRGRCRSRASAAMMARATTSRGARSASGCWPCMKRSPASSTRKAPSPRTASEMSGCWPREPSPSHRTVGWNWTNSRSASDGAGAQRGRHAVAGRDGRVRRRGVDLAEATGREHDGARVRGADAVDLALADDVERHAAHPRRRRRSAGRRRARAR